MCIVHCTKTAGTVVLPRAMSNTTQWYMLHFRRTHAPTPEIHKVAAQQVLQVAVSVTDCRVIKDRHRKRLVYYSEEAERRMEERVYRLMLYSMLMSFTETVIKRRTTTLE